jgi:hypothetical protein
MSSLELVVASLAGRVLVASGIAACALELAVAPPDALADEVATGRLLGDLAGGGMTAGRAPRPGGGKGELFRGADPTPPAASGNPAGLLMPSSVVFIPLSIPRSVGGGGGTDPDVGGGGGVCDVRVALFFPSPSKTSRSDPPLLFTAIAPVSWTRDERGVVAGLARSSLTFSWIEDGRLPSGNVRRR